jgi:glycosyltransferase involved in cell wall biosynthesis
MIISILIVVRNAKDNIVNCIQSIESQFQEGNQAWELIIVDGMSSDGSKEIATQYLKNKSYSWMVLDNPKKILASGWNIGIKAAKGKYVLRPDVHATLHKGYISNGLKVLADQPDVTAVGGALQTQSKGFWGEIIAQALSSKIGVGGSPFRTNTADGFVDTVAYGIYSKSIFDKVGYFNETLKRHQDNDMHDRIKKVGGTFYLFGQMKADYYCRSTIYSLAKQMFQNGYYLTQLSIKKLRLRHLMPLIFYGGLGGALLLTYFGMAINTLALLQLGCYFFTIALFSIKISIKDRHIKYGFLTIVIPIMHMTYALGMFLGLIKSILIKIRVL